MSLTRTVEVGHEEPEVLFFVAVSPGGGASTEDQPGAGDNPRAGHGGRFEGELAQRGQRRDPGGAQRGNDTSENGGGHPGDDGDQRAGGPDHKPPGGQREPEAVEDAFEACRDADAPG